MAPKRPEILVTSSYGTPAKRRRHSQKGSNSAKFKDVRLHIVQAKLDGKTVSDLISLAENHGCSLCETTEDAHVILTEIRMRKRLQRHLDWDLARQKAIVTPQWLRDSVAHGSPLPCADYASISELRRETEVNCPTCGCGGHETDDDSDSGSEGQPLVRKRQRRESCEKCLCTCETTSASDARHLDEHDNHYASPAHPTHDNSLPTPPSSLGLPQSISPIPLPVISSSETSSNAGASSHARSMDQVGSSRMDALPNLSRGEPAYLKAPGGAPVPPYLLPPDPPLRTDIDRLKPSAQYTVQRASPLTCPNQALVCALDIIRRSRELEDEARSALSYARAIAALKAHSRKITSRHDVAGLPYVGEKISGMVEEFVEKGEISEASHMARSERFRSLSLFASVYGIGPTTARMLWARGLRSLDDLERWYGVDPEVGRLREEPSEIAPPDSGGGFKADEDTSVVLEEEGEDSKENFIKVALGYREDFTVKIPREEVEEMARVVMEEIDRLEPGCVSTIVGGYRRGKPASNDVDVVYTHPDRAKAESLCKRMVRRLIERGLITYVIHYSSARHSFGPRESHFDSLEKALSVFVLPYSSPIAQSQIKQYGHRLRRRFDLIFARPEQYWCAVVGWSGSTMFQRDLRLWAKKEKGMKFDSSGMTRRRDTKIFYPRTEREVFELLDLKWIDPTLRNADA